MGKLSRVFWSLECVWWIDESVLALFIEARTVSSRTLRLSKHVTGRKQSALDATLKNDAPFKLLRHLTAAGLIWPPYRGTSWSPLAMLEHTLISATCWSLAIPSIIIVAVTVVSYSYH